MTDTFVCFSCKRLLLLASLVGVLVALVLVRAADPAAGAPAAVYRLSWWSADGGGASAGAGAGYALSGSVGQPDAGTLQGDGINTLQGGFWGAATRWHVYLPSAVRGP
jgi:hypothetical protein